VTTGRVFVAYLTLHTVSLGEDFSRVVVDEVRQADAKVPVPTSEVRFVREAPSTFENVFDSVQEGVN